MTAHLLSRNSKQRLWMSPVHQVIWRTYTDHVSERTETILTVVGNILLIFFNFLGTFVMQVIATDADEENTLRSKIFYSIDESTNSGGMFMIDSQTGVIRVRKNTLDREVRRHTRCSICTVQ